MDDVRQRLHDVEGFQPPDLWSEITGRQPTPSLPEPAPRHRIFTIVVAFTIAVVSLAFAARAFRRDVAPRTTPSPSVSYSPRELETLPVGSIGQTNTILSAEGSVWITAYGVNGGGGVDGDMLFRIDPTSDEIISRIPLDTAPTSEFGTGVTFADGSIWITGGGRIPGGESQALIQRVDPVENRVIATIPLGGRFGADVAGNDAGVWVGIFTTGNAELVRVDPSTNEVIDRTTLTSQYVRRVVAINGAVMVEELEWAHGGGPCGYLTIIDPATAEQVVRRPLSDSCGFAGDLQVWNGAIWANIDEGFVPLDPRTAQPAGESLRFEADHSPRGFLVTDPTGIWYAAYPGNDGNGPDRLSRLNPATGEINSYMRLDHGPTSAIILDGSLWTVNYDGTVTRTDLGASG